MPRRSRLETSSISQEEEVPISERITIPSPPVPEEEAPISERPTRPVPAMQEKMTREAQIIMDRAEEEGATTEALAAVHQHLHDLHREEFGEAHDLLASSAIVRANVIRRSLTEKPPSGDNAWELIHELHAFEYDVEAALEDAPNNEDLRHAQHVIRDVLDAVRPAVQQMPERIAQEGPEAEDVGYTLWEDAREAREALAGGTLTFDDAARLKTLFIERVQRLEDDEQLLEQSEQDSSGVRLRPQNHQSIIRAIRELHTAIHELGRLEQRSTEETAKAPEPRLKTPKEQREEAADRELTNIIKRQQKLASDVRKKYGRTPEELMADGGPSGFLHGLRSLLSSETDDAQDPYQKWKALQDQRELLEAVRTRSIPLVTMSGDSKNPIPLVRRAKEADAFPLPQKKSKGKRA